MSGGVDSSVAAFLLCEQGFHVEGLFMKNWEEDDDNEYCAAEKDLADAKQICEKLNIRLHTVNFSSEYWDLVFEHFIKEYKSGRTPNPDIICNKEIKFRAFLDYAIKMGADLIATGHYARCENKNSFPVLMKSFDKEKDQTYFLHTLDSQQLGYTLFPLGELNKNNVRSIAKNNNFNVHSKKDSTGICFIGERKFKEFLKRYVHTSPGKILTLDGKDVGKHDGIMFYTIGQRHGLGIGGQQDSSEDPWYVAEKDVDNNILYVVQGHNHEALFHSKAIIHNMHWIGEKVPSDTFNLSAKIRYRQTDMSCKIEYKDKETLLVLFESPQWAMTPGQSIVFYDNDICLGGGIIEGRQK